MSPRLAIDTSGCIEPDGFGRLHSAVRELAYEVLPVGIVNESPATELWRALAERKVCWPRETDNTYYSGIWIPDDWVGRGCHELQNPFEPLADLIPMRISSLYGDQAVLLMPTVT